MTTDDYEHIFKVLLVGDSGVGKTSLLLQFTSGEYREAIRNTVGVDLKVKTVIFKGHKLKLTLWDTAGQERFRTLTSAYYRGAHGIILVYSIAERDSFNHLTHWLKEIDMYCTNQESILILVGNKSDVEDSARQVSFEEGKAFAKEHDMLFTEASAMSHAGVQLAFEELLQSMLDSPKLHEAEKRASASGTAGVKVTAEYDDEDEAQHPPGCCG